MHPDVKKLLQDILDSIAIVESYFKDVPTLSVYKGNSMLTDAVERRLAIVGEALWKADKLDHSLSITSKKKIISLRHILVHDYDLIEDETIWVVVNRHLPILKEEIQNINLV